MAFRQKKHLGQNFIHDESVLREIIEAALVTAGQRIVEIGPGEGTLTQQLLAVGCEVLAVEIDPELARMLEQHFAGNSAFSLMTRNFLDLSLAELLASRQWETKTYSIVANIPYYITAPIIKKLLTEFPRPERITLLVQKEVAERLAGAHDNRSLLSVMANYYAEVSLGPVIGKEHFTPAPKVESQVVTLTPTRSYDEETDKQFFRFVRAGFAGRRKTLANNLAALPEFTKIAIEHCLTGLGWSPSVRAQELSVTDWLKLRERLAGS